MSGVARPESVRHGSVRQGGVSRAADAPASAALRREDVLRAAAEVFMEKGYGGASLSEIAERMGSTKGKLYYYYESKYELYLDIHETALRWATERCIAARDSEAAPDRQLRAMARSQALLNLEGAPMIRVAIQGLERYLMNAGNGPLDKLTRRLIGRRAEFEEMYREVIGRGVREGVFPAGTDVSLSAKWVLGAINWIVVWASPGKRPGRSRDAIAGSAADFVLGGIMAGAAQANH